MPSKKDRSRSRIARASAPCCSGTPCRRGVPSANSPSPAAPSANRAKPKSGCAPGRARDLTSYGRLEIPMKHPFSVPPRGPAPACWAILDRLCYLGNRSRFVDRSNPLRMAADLFPPGVDVLRLMRNSLPTVRPGTYGDGSLDRTDDSSCAKPSRSLDCEQPNLAHQKMLITLSADHMPSTLMTSGAECAGEVTCAAARFPERPDARVSSHPPIEPRARMRRRARRFEPRWRCASPRPGPRQKPPIGQTI